MHPLPVPGSHEYVMRTAGSVDQSVAPETTASGSQGRLIFQSPHGRRTGQSTCVTLIHATVILCMAIIVAPSQGSASPVSTPGVQSRQFTIGRNAIDPVAEVRHAKSPLPCACLPCARQSSHGWDVKWVPPFRWCRNLLSEARLRCVFVHRYSCMQVWSCLT